MTIQPVRRVEMTNSAPPVLNGPAGREETGQGGDIFERVTVRPEPSGASADTLMPPTAAPSPLPTWRDKIQTMNQAGWAGFAIRWVPILALAVTIMGGVFSYMNHRALDAQKSLKLLRSLQPALVAAHEKILATAQSIQQSLGINATEMAPVPDMDPMVPPPIDNSSTP